MRPGSRNWHLKSCAPPRVGGTLDVEHLASFSAGVRCSWRHDEDLLPKPTIFGCRGESSHLAALGRRFHCIIQSYRIFPSLRRSAFRQASITHRLFISSAGALLISDDFTAAGKPNALAGVVTTHDQSQHVTASSNSTNLYRTHGIDADIARQCMQIVSNEGLQSAVQHAYGRDEDTHTVRGEGTRLDHEVNRGSHKCTNGSNGPALTG